MVSFNVKRIERDIEKYIPMILETKSRDDMLKKVTITDCDLTHDLSFCKVYFTALDVDEKEITKRLNDASSFIRKNLSDMLEVRNTPVLKFEYDKSIDYANRIEKVISNLHK